MSRAFGLRIGLTAGVVLALALGLAATLTALTAARTASGLAEARWLRETSAQAQTIGRAVAVGLPLSALTTPGNALADLPTQRSDIAAACVVDEREVAVFGALSPLLIAAHFKVEKPTLVRLTPGRTAVLQPVLGSHGERAGTVAIVFDRAALRHAADHFNRHCQKAALLAWVVAVVLAGGLAAVTQRQLNVGLHGFADIARFRRRLLLSFGSLLLAALTGFGMLVRQPLLSDINQQIHTSIEATAKELATTFARIAASGAPLDRLRGMDQLLASVRQDVPEIETLTVSLPHGTHYHDGTPVDSLRAPALRLAVANAGNAVITVHIRAEAGRDHARTVAYDLLTVAVVTVLVAWELLGFALSHAVVAPLMRHNSTSDDGGYGELYRVRLPLFLMIFSEAMALPFLPLLARSLDGGEWLALPSSIRAAMPITIFMVCWGLSQPPAGSWSDRVGRRRSLLVGIALAGLGQIGAGLAQDWWQLLAARMVGGIGYGIGFISCSAYVQDRTNLTNRSRGMSMFVWAFSAGTLCGTASGGLLADRLGQQATLLVAAMIMAVAWIAVHSCLLSDRATTLVARVRLSDLWQLLRQSRFAFLALLAGIPPKLVITGVNAFVMPLYLDHLGLGSAAIGRMLMLFNLATIACSELVAPLADRTQQYRTWVIGGGLLSGITLMLSSTTSDLLALSAAVTLLGAANGIGQAPLLAMVPRTAGPALQTLGPGTVMGLFRLLERVGSMIGPLMAGLLIAGCGYASTLVWTGALCLFATLSFWLSERKQPCA